MEQITGHKTLDAANTFQLNQELIYLYVKKQKLNEQLYPFKMRPHVA
jgi:hypothetical protein